ncbi:MAG TPA: hypothetical protein GX019_10865 [Firmicutes bacterium]|nr:hypothetical protein [Bacillota bacterium]
MNWQVIETQGKRYLLIVSSGTLIETEQEAYDIVFTDEEGALSWLLG